MKTRPNENQGRLSKWMARNRSDLRFLLLFGTFMGAYYLITLTPTVRDGFFPAYLRWNASISGRALRTLGEELTVEDQNMISDKGPSVQIERGCDAVEPSALFVSAVLASPVPLLARLSAAMVGTLLLLLINLVRVASLFLVRVYYPSAFDVIHLDVWQALFIFLAITLWALWAARMSRKRKEHEHAAT